MEGKRQEMMKSATDRQHQVVDWKEVGRSGQNGRHERRSVVPIFRNKMSPHHDESPFNAYPSGVELRRVATSKCNISPKLVCFAALGLVRVVIAVTLLLVMIQHVNGAGYDEACSQTSQCLLKNSVCVKEYPSCKLGRCSCIDTYLYDHNSQKCLPARLLGGDCRQGETVCYDGACMQSRCWCLSPLLTASEDKTECVPMKLSPVACSGSKHCRGSPLLEQCVNGTCQCRPGMILRDGYCMAPRLGEDCSQYGRCSSTLVCENDTCQCRNGQKHLTGVMRGDTFGYCVPEAALTGLSAGEVCTRDLLKICGSRFTCDRCPEWNATTTDYRCLDPTTQTSTGNASNRPCLNASTVAPNLELTLAQSYYSCTVLLTQSYYSCTVLLAPSYYSCTVLLTQSYYSCNVLLAPSYYSCTVLLTQSYYSCTVLLAPSYYSCTVLLAQSYYIFTVLLVMRPHIMKNCGTPNERNGGEEELGSNLKSKRIDNGSGQCKVVNTLLL
ncbi:hypothetical protein LSAT2_025959 [Lamellibrachia satsuma]|nr:hypothetical protein LSAT2_025959 [Lamellibrachia satsuma]